MGIEFIEEEKSSSIEFLDGGGPVQSSTPQTSNPVENPTVFGSKTAGDVLVRPGAAIRSTIQSLFNDDSPVDAFRKGSLRPGAVPTFQDLALEKFAPKTESVAANFAGGLVPSAAGLIADIATNPADVALMLTGTLAGPRIAQTAIGKSIGGVLTKERHLLKTPEQLVKKAEQLTTQVLQPLKSELMNAFDKGNQLPAVREAAKFIQKSRNFTELRQGIDKSIKSVFNKRNQILSENNRPVGESYMDDLARFINKQKAKGQAKPSEIKEMENVLLRERQFFKSNKGLDRVNAQGRKEFFQKRTERVLSRQDPNKPGQVTELEGARALAENELRNGLKKMVEMGDPVIAEINSTYGGLLRARKLAAAEEAVVAKDIGGKGILKRAFDLFNSRGNLAGQSILRRKPLSRSTAKIEGLMKKARKRSGAKTALDEFLP